MFDDPGTLKAAGATLALAILWLVEGALPMFEGRSARAGHGARNLALGVGNAAVTAIIFAAATLVVTEGARERGFGLLHLLDPPGWARIALAVLLFDAWQYLWHRLNHQVPFLWRFHQVHHSDAELDATSGLRFHTGEIVLSSIARLAVLPLLGLTVAELLVYETILLPIILFHHSNLRVPGAVDRGLRWLVVTPWMHWVHHSDYQPETDSNYSSIFSFWDRAFGSFRLRSEPREIRLGLDNMHRSEWGTLRGMLAMPFRRGRGRSSAPEQGSTDGRP